MNRIYVIVPCNLDLPDGKKLTMTCGRAAAHASHAAGMLGQKFDTAYYDLLVLAVPNHGDLEQLKNRLEERSLNFVEYWDEDRLYQGSLLTALATEPLDEAQRDVVADLKPWRCKCNAPFSGSSEKEH